MNNILLVAAENSAENYALQILAEFRSRYPAIHFLGVGGERLEQQGLEVIVPSRRLALAGIIEVLFRLLRIKKALDLLYQEARRRQVRAALLIDFPDFNLRLAKRLHKAGIPVYYYIAPTVWAWRYRRIEKIRAAVRHLFVIFPFESSIYESEAMPFTYTGHPLLTMLKEDIAPEKFRQRLGVAAGEKLVALLPGSRRMEVKFLLPRMLKALRRLPAAEHVRGCILLARSIDQSLLLRYGAAAKLLVCPQEEAHGLLRAADAVLTTCGTSNLEAALCRAPFIAAYRVRWLNYLLGKRLVKIRRYSIVNILLGKEVVPELIQRRCTARQMAVALQSLLDDKTLRQRMLADFDSIRRLLDEGRQPAEIIASHMAADLALN